VLTLLGLVTGLGGTTGCGSGTVGDPDLGSRDDRRTPADGPLGEGDGSLPDADASGDDLRVSDAVSPPDRRPTDGAPADGGPGPDGAVVCTRATAIDCPAGTTCDIDGCEASAPGLCLPPPDKASCGEAGGPVCGCDGYSYPSDCARLRAGVARESRGECAAAGPCATSAPRCDALHVCDVRGCGEDVETECVSLFATCPEGGQPECGCDGETYANRCLRLRQGVALARRGAC
jgi:hypothetical protein